MRRRLPVILALVVVLVVALAQPGHADRRAKKPERKAVQKLALALCADQPSCTKRPVRVSTVNKRYAFGGAVGEMGMSGVLAKKSKPKKSATKKRAQRKAKWRVVAFQGGGVEVCSHWLAAAPPKVLRDLGLKGVSARRPGGGWCKKSDTDPRY